MRRSAALSQQAIGAFEPWGPFRREMCTALEGWCEENLDMELPRWALEGMAVSMLSDDASISHSHRAPAHLRSTTHALRTTSIF